MTTLRCHVHLPVFALVLAAALITTQCSNSTSSPTSPTSTLAVASVVLTPSIGVAGTTMSGVVTLTAAAAAGGASVSLVSSNTGVATVPTPIVIAAGASNATFIVTTSSPGAATITAAMNGAGASSSLTVTTGLELSTVSLAAATIVGGDGVIGTVTLTGAAGPGGAVVTLASTDPADVLSFVNVPAGLRTATFTVTTRLVTATTVATVTATYGGGSKSAALAVTPVPTSSGAVAGFGVSGTFVTDTCQLTSDGNSLDCTFDGSISTTPGTIVAWEWSYSVATTMTQTTTGPVFSMPAANCAFLPPPPLAAGASSFPLTVRLIVRDSLGNVSAQAVNDGARVLPQGACGF